ncbi:MAG: response regulator [Chloroflexi bacterium]|nr:response regulator [Chloroflexota bacterium]
MEGVEETLSILVVEDDQPTAELLRIVFNDVPGWGATVVHEPIGAQEVFRHVRLDVLVLDVNLPGMSGLELLATLRQDPRWRESPVILISAAHNQAGILDAVECGQAARFVPKPFDICDLLDAVTSEVARARRTQPCAS